MNNILFNEHWDRVLEKFQRRKSLIGRLDQYHLAWQRFQYQLDENGKEELITSHGKVNDLLKVIDKCTQ